MSALNLIIIPAISLAIVLTIMPLLRIVAIQLQLVDKPSGRKAHNGQIPLAGGLAISFATMLTLLVSTTSWSEFSGISFILLAGGILLVIGVIDDKSDLRASMKLTIQIALAYFAFANGIRIETFHGILGIYEIPVLAQYFITLIVITGVVNAFNLMDGIDGLAAGLAIVACTLFGWMAYITGQFMLLNLFLALIGALVGFMRFNFSSKVKVFMGDAGSLFIGLIMVLSAISLIQAAQGTSEIRLVFPVVIGVLALPVLDSLRVYRRRAKDGFSPFRADRTHFHHLVLQLGIKHRSATLLVIFVSAILIALSITIGSLTSFTFMILALMTAFIAISWILSLNSKVMDWKEKVLAMEKR
ncbi:MAG: undecaprenyl/decaprenyl-phosphate alpha-N-acetylglucosaminyl 1-phosphate transferase [Balneolaceae bacterium]|nr:MAG: undecaprenyl/decaprenyl-phosphate alpha-N-acetylglucosaminyl 1-phosphate transferase [Balneolaceae bacterium]